MTITLIGLVKRKQASMQTEGSMNSKSELASEETVFTFNEDGLFDVKDESVAGGIQTSIGSATSEEHAGFFCTNKKDCQ